MARTWQACAGKLKLFFNLRITKWYTNVSFGKTLLLKPTFTNYYVSHVTTVHFCRDGACALELVKKKLFKSSSTTTILLACGYKIVGRMNIQNKTSDPLAGANFDLKS